jgi:hypothetical protein
MNTPLQYQQLKIRSKSIPENQANVASIPTPALIDAFTAVKNDYADLAIVKRDVEIARQQFEATVRSIEANHNKIATEMTLKIHLESLSALIKNTASKVVDFGVTMMAYVEEEKVIPHKLSDTERLERVVEKFPEVQQYLKRLDASVKKYDKTEISRRLIEWGKRPVDVSIER